jgi:hypothetical protein
MDDSRLMKCILYGKPTHGVRKVGCPKKSWREAVKDDLKLLGISYLQPGA